MPFENYVQEASNFVNEVAEELGNANDFNRAMRVTRTVFHTVRDMLTTEESLHLVSQLPMILKGVYVEGWKIENTDRLRTMTEFLEQLRMKSDRPEIDFGNDENAVHTVQCVFQVLQRHVTTGEITDVMGQFPKELRVLWNAPEQHHH